jgi:phosphoribosyl 1,2-cyclic phosphodiesterase
MYIRCWGSRGSVPVSGKEYIKYGGDTTCMEIRSQDNDLIIIDSGTGIRKLGEKLAKENEKNITILYTHFHLDHIAGFPFFKPVYKKGTTINILSKSFNKPTIKTIFDLFMGRPFFPVQLEDKDIKANILFKEINKQTFKIGSITISTIPLSHPKDSGLGFRFEENGKSFVFLTDNELGHRHDGGGSFNEYVEFCKDADLLIHDAEYEQKEYHKILKSSEGHWGHSIVSDVVNLAIEARVKQLGLFHINAMRTDELVDEMVIRAKESIAKKKKNIICYTVGSSFEMVL